ncbi:hypothetical protein PHYPSEUDO_006603 [Phytophthora pseudosyringae]|uniref:Uncharacterized protein n=1 Tax=Phytophthora pseudosyringae TaxID=221518 RepID=A0A8T1VL45_9STRA|nr:hypothetical protein PHYPSEUDO_006603 [Phytophthora pseudosyringae]
MIELYLTSRSDECFDVGSQGNLSKYITKPSTDIEKVSGSLNGTMASIIETTPAGSTSPAFQCIRPDRWRTSPALTTSKMAVIARAASSDPSKASPGADSFPSSAFAGIDPVLGCAGSTESGEVRLASVWAGWSQLMQLVVGISLAGGTGLALFVVVVGFDGDREGEGSDSLVPALAAVGSCNLRLALVSEVAMSARVSALVAVLAAHNSNVEALALAGWTALKSHGSVLMKASTSSAEFLSTRTLPICILA